MSSKVLASVQIVWAVREALSNNQIDAMQILGKF